jgi:predicted SnoaL-like aldol condensation-catalyzing enzyme
VSDPGKNKAVVLDHEHDLLASFPPEFIIAEADLVTVAHHELRGEGDGELDFFGFRTYRLADGAIVEQWSNDAKGSAPVGSGRRQHGRPAAPVGAGDPVANKPKVADLYRCVFDARNAGAVRDFVAEDYLQRSRHMPTGRAGLETFVTSIFPDGPVETPAQPSIPPSILMGEGDLVVIAAALPQPDGDGETYLRYIYDAYRVRDGLLAEHWSGVDPQNPPAH